MRYPNETYTPITREDWEAGGGPCSLDKVIPEWLAEYARQHGGTPAATIDDFRLWHDALTVDETVDALGRVWPHLQASNDEDEDEDEEIEDDAEDV